MSGKLQRELDRRLSQARRLALEPTDVVTPERLAQLIEDLESQLAPRSGKWLRFLQAGAPPLAAPRHSDPQ